MHQFTAILDTRPRGSRHGAHHVCACGRRHLMWVCFREVRVGVSPKEASALRFTPTGKTLVVGVGCAAKVLVPVWESHRVAAALEDPQRVALHPGDPGYGKLFQEFR